jgi:hypothetical protein
MKENTDYQNYRWFFTSSGKLVIGGKNAEQNEEIMKKIKNDDIIFHTSAPGSPFCIIKNPTNQEMEEVAIFTAAFSKQWKSSQKFANVHIFEGKQVAKSKDMKTGTFGVLGKAKTKKVELKLVLDFQDNKLRAIPKTAAKNPILTIIPGDLSKEKAAEEIKELLKNKNINLKIEEIMSAIPSDRLKIIS